MYQPKISIITVSYNAQDVIKETIQSVLNQTYENIEYIIIDGNSNDKTVEIINEFCPYITYWESSPDLGIYDAMNKGVQYATGEWVHFLNCGDLFMSNLVLETIVNANVMENSYVVYGNIVCRHSCGLYVLEPAPLDLFKTLFPISHPATLVRKECFKNYCFDINLKIAGDFKFLRQLYFANYTFSYFPLNWVLFDAEGGVSSNSHLLMYKENLLVVKERISIIDIFKINLFRGEIILRHLLKSLLSTSQQLKIKSKMICLNYRYKIYNNE